MTQNNLLPAPIIINTDEGLQQLITALRAEKRIAVDTESNSLYVYQEKVCLIQFSTSSADYLLDPLSDIDLTPLGEVFSDDHIEKIFHAAEYDIICLRRDFGFEFKHIFDTMQAARVLGYPKLGLSSLLEEHFGVMVDKRYQKANWGRRPLPQEMLDYARLDTHYLIPLRDLLFNSLRRMDRLRVAVEDFTRISHSSATPNDKPCYAVARGYHTLNPHQLAVLNELCVYRERQAFHANLPAFKILSSSVLLEIAKKSPTTIAEMQSIPGLSDKLLHRHALGLIQAVKLGLVQPPIHLNHHAKPSQSYIDRLERLKKWRLQRAREKGLESDVILPRDLLEEIAKSNPHTDQELSLIMRAMPERFKLYHDFIMEALKEKEI